MLFNNDWFKYIYIFFLEYKRNLLNISNPRETPYDKFVL